MPFENYQDPIIYRKRTGSITDEFPFINQTDKVRNSTILLREIPNKFRGLTVKSGTKTYSYKDSGLPDSNTAIVDWTNGILTFSVTEEGKTVTVDYYGEGNVYLPSSKVYVEVDENGDVATTLKELTDDTLIARDTTEQLNTTVANAENTRVSNETTRQNNESSRGNAETLRESNESTRIGNENTRKNAETTRGNNESSRVSAESNRESAEALRASAETARISAEDLRITAEEIREQNEDERQFAITNTKYAEPYNTISTYQKNNIVSFNGASYIAKQTTTGNAPTEGTDNVYWGLLSRKGDTGLSSMNVMVDIFTAVEGQTVFNLSGTYDQFVNRLEVVVGGVPQYSGDNFDETTSSSFTLAEGISAGTIVRAKYFNIL